MTETDEGGAANAENNDDNTPLQITITTDSDTLSLIADKQDVIWGAVSAKLEAECAEVLLGDEPVLDGETFADCGVENGARLSIRVKYRATVEDFVNQLLMSNPHLKRSQVWKSSLRVDASDPSTVHGDWGLPERGIRELPDSIGSLTVEGDFYLNDNLLTSLPPSIGGLTVTGYLNLSGNQLRTLPDSFSSISIGRCLYLNHNQLQTMPENFGNLQLPGGSLLLHNNKLQSLPDSFGELSVGGTLDLQQNQLQSLPESFGHLTVGFTLDISSNQLTKLPPSVSFLDIGGDFKIYGNPIEALDLPNLCSATIKGRVSIGHRLQHQLGMQAADFHIGEFQSKPA